MKKTLFYMAALLWVAGCSDSAPETDEGATGLLHITATTDAQVATRQEVPSGSNLSAEELSLRITGPDFEREWPTCADYAAEAPRLMKGDYTVEVFHGDPTREGEQLPYYHGSTQVSVLPRQEVSARVEASIANAQVTVRLTPAFTDYFHDAKFTLTTRDGATFAFHPANTDACTPVYVRAGSAVTLNGDAARQAGDRVEFATQHLEPTVARTRHTFVFDAKHAGHATVTITLDDSTTQTRDIFVELNPNA